ncbi:hypothetical protein B0T20DRAFT_471462 [Sordaria brevicollis]|uniref:Uncharacterized protein n=1 Tax=Sordaria brevicollis TaxID=83679 RepID=A0AAE0UA43_SORBR|nr:hypothetical protein B0T20DRAFT_471462 [Sordaria brevicollis]
MHPASFLSVLACGFLHFGAGLALPKIPTSTTTTSVHIPREPVHSEHASFFSTTPSPTARSTASILTKKDEEQPRVGKSLHAPLMPNTPVVERTPRILTGPWDSVHRTLTKKTPAGNLEDRRSKVEGFQKRAVGKTEVLTGVGCLIAVLVVGGLGFYVARKHHKAKMPANIPRPK